MLHPFRRSDDFSTTLSGLWVRRNSGSDPQTSSGLLTCSSTSGFYPAEYIAIPTQTGDQSVSVTIAALSAGSSAGIASGLMLRCPNSATAGTVPFAYFNNRQIGIYTMTTWAGGSATARASLTNMNGGSNIAVGTRIEFRVDTNIFRTFVNGVLLNTWNDSGAIANPNARYGGAIIQRGTDGLATGNQQFDDFSFGPARPIDIPMPTSAVTRPAFY